MVEENKYRYIFKVYKDLLHSYFKKIGPKNILEKKNDRDIFQLEGDLYHNSDYFNGGHEFKDNIFDKIKNHKNEISYDTSFLLFKFIIKSILDRIKGRNTRINDYLNKYLIDEDYNESFKVIRNKLEEIFGVYRFIFITNYIEYECTNILDLEKIKIGRLDSLKKYIPENIDYPYSATLAKLLSKGHYIKRNNFLKDYGKKTFIEVEIEGYHFLNEKSDIFNKCVYELKQIFSFLHLLKDLYVLKKLQPEIGDWNIKSKNIEYNESMYIYPYVINKKGKYLSYIDHNISNISNLRQKIILNEKCINLLLREEGIIDKFNKCVISKKYGDLSDKYKRSLDWFFKSQLENDFTDEAIYLFISLESLLSTNPDPFTSFSNNLADNLVLLSFPKNPEFRYEHKQEFKKVYSLRNKIMHHGHTISTKDDLKSIALLKYYSFLSIYNYLNQIDKISKIGCKIGHLNKYFDLKKFE